MYLPQPALMECFVCCSVLSATALVTVMGRTSGTDADAQRRKKYADLQLNVTGNSHSYRTYWQQYVVFSVLGRKHKSYILIYTLLMRT
jgi:hypothetical protein